jgi:integrase
MATITKIIRPSGTVYKARTRRNGKPGPTRTFRYRSDAEKWAKREEGSFVRDAVGLTVPSEKHTLRGAIARYRAERLPELAKGTRVAYDIHLRFWDRHLGSLKLSDLRPEKIAELRDQLQGQGKKPAGVNRYLAALAAVLTRCVKHWHILESNPVHRVAKLVENNARQRFLTEPELALLLEACRESNSSDLYLAVLLAITTGARQGEILGLRWPDVDLQQGIITLPPTKNGDARTLAIAAQVLPLLTKRKARLHPDNITPLYPHGLVFPSRVSPAQPVNLRDGFTAAVKRAGLGDFHWHDLRHSTASFLAEDGASLRQIGEVLGHRSVEATRRYAHLTEQSAHQLVRGLADKLLGDGK